MKFTQLAFWTAAAIATLLVAAGPDLVGLPVPKAQIILDRAVQIGGDEGGQEVSLPLALYPRPGSHQIAFRYETYFDLASADADLFLLVPTVNRRVSFVLNGEAIFGGITHAIWVGPTAVTSILVQLPRSVLVTGRNRLLLSVEYGQFAFPAYLSRLYIDTESALTPNFALRLFLGDHLKTMALAAHMLLGVGLICAYFFRPKDPLFFWLANFNIYTLVLSVGLFIGFHPQMQNVTPYIVTLLPSSFMFLFLVALTLVGIPTPRYVYYIALLPSFALMPLAIISTLPARIISAMLATGIAVVLIVLTTGVTAWGALRWKNRDAGLMLIPSFIMAWFAVRDVIVVASLPAQELSLLFPYARPLYLATLTVVLMRRLGTSLDQVDHANEVLNAKLAVREAELAIISRHEQLKVGNLIREHERQRLTHDLHDGISGHLASIIALSERSGEKPTELAAREALNDLRLVIYSLDLGDHELPLALANFRLRLIPQLQRLGVTLDWSITGLPEVSGVTPGNALAILRIIQEAITNALKHGPATEIKVHGSQAEDGSAILLIENDGRPFVAEKNGSGVNNMHRRARQLHGALTIEAKDHGTIVALRLPTTLPDFENEGVEKTPSATAGLA